MPPLPKRFPAGYFFLTMHAHRWGAWWEAFLWPLHLQNLTAMFRDYLRDRWIIITRAEKVTWGHKDLGRLLARIGVRPVRIGRRYWAFPGSRLEHLNRFASQIEWGDFSWFDTPTDPRGRPLPRGLAQMIAGKRQPPMALENLKSTLTCILHDDDILDLYIRGTSLRRLFLARVFEYFMRNRWSPGYFDNASNRYLRRVRTIQFSVLPGSILARVQRHMETTGLYCSVEDLTLNGPDLRVRLWKGVPAWPGCSSLPKLETVNKQLGLRYRPSTAHWSLSPVVASTWPYDPRTGKRKQFPKDSE